LPKEQYQIPREDKNSYQTEPISFTTDSRYFKDIKLQDTKGNNAK
jgi:hypothetical protein